MKSPGKTAADGCRIDIGFLNFAHEGNKLSRGEGATIGRGATVAEISSIETRLRLLGIDDDTRHNLRVFYPVFEDALGRIVEKFYAHILTFPDAAELLAGSDVKNQLMLRQKVHWQNLFSCRFDQDYVTEAIRIGKVHFDRKVPPYIYIAGYSFFHGQIVRLATRHYDATTGLQEVLIGAGRLIALDMDLALSAYMREYGKAVVGPGSRA